MMVFVADFFAPSKKAVKMRAKKLYCRLAPDKKGRESKPFFEPYYRKNKHEVDFVHDDSRKIIPVEIKYREPPTNADLKGLIEL